MLCAPRLAPLPALPALVLPTGLRCYLLGSPPAWVPRSVCTSGGLPLLASLLLTRARPDDDVPRGECRCHQAVVPSAASSPGPCWGSAQLRPPPLRSQSHPSAEPPWCPPAFHGTPQGPWRWAGPGVTWRRPWGLWGGCDCLTPGCLCRSHTCSYPAWGAPPSGQKRPSPSRCLCSPGRPAPRGGQSHFVEGPARPASRRHGRRLADEGFLCDDFFLN